MTLLEIVFNKNDFVSSVVRWKFTRKECGRFNSWKSWLDTKKLTTSIRFTTLINVSFLRNWISVIKSQRRFSILWKSTKMITRSCTLMPLCLALLRCLAWLTPFMARAICGRLSTNKQRTISDKIKRSPWLNSLMVKSKISGTFLTKWKNAISKKSSSNINCKETTTISSNQRMTYM